MGNIKIRDINSKKRNGKFLTMKTKKIQLDGIK